MSDIGSLVDGDWYGQQDRSGSDDKRLTLGTSFLIWIAGSLFGWGAIFAVLLPFFA